MNWHVLTVRPQRELALARQLEVCWPECGGPPPIVYVPLDGTDRRRTLFPGYALANFEKEQSPHLALCLDVRSVLGDITDEEVELIRTLEKARAERIRLGFHTGELVEISLYGIAVIGTVLEQQGDRVKIAASVLSGCSIWVSRAMVRRVV